MHTQFKHPAQKPFDSRRWYPKPSLFEDKLSRIESIIRSHPLETTSQFFCERLIATIRHRGNDDRLYLGVVGEFSSGKSTFINALLREQFLDSSATEGTTVIPTFIEYRPPSLWERFLHLFGVHEKRIIEIFSERSMLERISIDLNHKESCHTALARVYGNLLPETIQNATAIRVGLP